MTHSVHPYSHRIGIIRDWKSRWFGVGKNYREFLRADVCLREYLEKRLRGFYVADLQIERGVNQYKIIIKTSRPGMLIGRGGDGVVKLKNDIYAKLKKIGAKIPKELSVEIEEVKEPEAEAAIVAYMIAEGLEKRMPFRRVLKQTVEKVEFRQGAGTTTPQDVKPVTQKTNATTPVAPPVIKAETEKTPSGNNSTGAQTKTD